MISWRSINEVVSLLWSLCRRFFEAFFPQRFFSHFATLTTIFWFKSFSRFCNTKIYILALISITMTSSFPPLFILSSFQYDCELFIGSIYSFSMEIRQINGLVVGLRLLVWSLWYFFRRGGVIKLVLVEVVIWFALYFTLFCTYQFVLHNTENEKTFIYLATYCKNHQLYSEVILMLGFFTAAAIARFWAIYQTMWWPDNAAMTLATYLRSTVSFLLD